MLFVAACEGVKSRHVMRVVEMTGPFRMKGALVLPSELTFLGPLVAFWFNLLSYAVAAEMP